MPKKKAKVVVPRKLLKGFSVDTLAYMAADLMDLRKEVDQKDWDKIFNPVFADIMDIGAERDAACSDEKEFLSKVAEVVAGKRKMARKKKK
jgi:hypothetical protein